MTAPVPPVKTGNVMPLLSVMMFLQFFIWGAWYVTAGRGLTFAGFSPDDIGWTYTVGPLAGILAPLFVGMVADRFFPTQKVLGVMHLAGAAAMTFAAVLLGGADASPTAVNGVFFVYMLCYMPTLALVNTVALHQFTDAERQFPMVRVFGTIGWIVAGMAISELEWGDSLNMFYLAAGASAAMGVFAFFLPHTPAPAAGQPFSAKQALGLDALVLLKRRSFLVFMMCSFLVCIPLAFYYQMAERTLGAGYIEDAPFKMTFGQMSEILFMVVMPFFFRRLGVKWMLAIGMLAWVVRYALFHLGMPDGVAWMLLLGVILHGICYDFFFVTGQIYTDKVAGPAIRGQAQGMLVLFTQGLGMAIGAQIAGRVEAAYTDADAKKALGPKVDAAEAALDALKESDASSEAIAAAKAALDAEKVEVLRTTDWSSIYLWPCLGALAVLIVFVALFRDRRADA